MSIMSLETLIKGLEEAKSVGKNVLEDTVGRNLLKHARKVYSVNKFMETVAYASAGSVLLALKETPFDEVLGRTLMRASYNEIAENLRSLFRSDKDLKKALEENGTLFGVSDPQLIIQNVAAIYASNNSRSSRFSSFVPSWNDEEDLAFNTQGAAPAEVVLDLTQEKPQKDMITVTFRETNVTFPADSARCAYEIVWGDKKTGRYISSAMEDRDRQRLLAKKGAFANAWPNKQFAEDLAETLNKDQVLDVKSIIKYKKGGKDMTETREDLHKRITEALNEVISPDLIFPSKDDYDRLPASGHPSFYVVGKDGKITSAYSLGSCKDKPAFNTMLATGVEGKIEDKDLPWDEKQPTHGSEDTEVIDVESKEVKTQTFPVTKDQCKIADGKYECPRCHKTVRKNGLNPYSPKNLPEGIPDTDDLLETRKWAMSHVCGTCADSLKVMREKAVSAFIKANKGTIEAANELEKLEAAYVEADDKFKAAKQDMEEKGEAIKILEGKGKVPEVLVKAYEEAKFNTQSAEAAVTKLSKEVEEATKKVAALKNGTATKAIALPPAPQITKNNATIISRPETMKLSRKERRAAAREAKRAGGRR